MIHDSREDPKMRPDQAQRSRQADCRSLRHVDSGATQAAYAAGVPPESSIPGRLAA